MDRLGVKATFYTNTLMTRDRASSEIISDYYDRLFERLTGRSAVG